MSMAHCDTRPHQRQYDRVFVGTYTSSYCYPMDMRTLLKALLALADENAYGLESRCDVPQATINRFLTGKHGDPRPSTVRKLAGAYGLTESQLRGDAPLPESLERQLERRGLLPSPNGADDDDLAKSGDDQEEESAHGNVVRLRRDGATRAGGRTEGGCRGSRAVSGAAVATSPTRRPSSRSVGRVRRRYRTCRSGR